MSAAGISAAAEPPWPVDALEVGRVVDAWGVKGWIKVQPFSNDPQALFASRHWHIRPPEPHVLGASAALVRFPASLTITDLRSHGDAIVAAPQGIADRNAAEALRGARIFVGRSSFPVTGKDEYYWADLIGLDVVNRDGARLGTIAGLLDTGPHSVLRVVPDEIASGADAERLIPFVSAYVDAVDLEQRRITVDWGLDF